MKRANTTASKRPAKRARTQNTQAMTTKIVKREMRKNTDWKYADTSQTGVAVYNLGAQLYSLWDSVSRGLEGRNDFVGNFTDPQAVLIKYHAETAQTFNVLRVLVFQWFDAGTPVLSGILQSTATGLACEAPILVTNKEYIKVLYDKTHMLAAPYSGGNGVMDPCTVYIPGKRLRRTKWNSGTSVVQDGNIYILLLSDDTALGTVNATYYARITFSD